MVVLQGLNVDVSADARLGLCYETQSEKKRYKLLPNSFLDLAENFYG